VQITTRNHVLAALRECGPLSVRELQPQLGPRSRGACSLHVLDYFTSIGGLSPDLRGALYTMLWSGDVEIVPVRRILRLRLGCARQSPR
jgi:hypothetical protein